jgi:ELWxxDGT repeat protein
LVITSSDEQLTNINGRLLLVGNNNSDEELFISDGNTASLLKDINGDPTKSSRIEQLTEVGKNAYFVANDSVGKVGLWKTDGTNSGTIQVTNQDALNLTNINGTLFYSSGKDIFKISPDGINTKVFSGVGKNSIFANSFRNVNGNLFFLADNSVTSGNLWRTDGTPEGTVNLSPNLILLSLNNPRDQRKVATLGNKIYFINETRITDEITGKTTFTGQELFVSDGTIAGTKLVKDINPGSEDSLINFVGATSDRLYFSARDKSSGNSSALWAVQDDGVVVPPPPPPLPKKGNVTGGLTGGKLLNDEVESRRDRRQVSFEEIKNPSSGTEPGQTWVVIHGWNSSTQADNIKALTTSIQNKVGSNDRVLALDWKEASVNTSLSGDNILALAEGDNGKAASWITPVAEYAVRTLQETYGIDAAKARESLNLVGHSLGTYVSSEIGRIYRDGGNLIDPFPASPETANTTIAANGEGVRTLTALDPAATTNLPLLPINGEPLPSLDYDLDGRAFGGQTPQNFKDVSVFSRSYNGAQSIAGNEGRAVTADEAIQMDFGNTLPNADEHGRVVEGFAKLFEQTGEIGDLLGANAYQSIADLPINDFAVLNNRNGYRGILNVEKSDDAVANNRSDLLISQANTDPKDDIVIGSAKDDDIQGAAQDIRPDSTPALIGDDRYTGDGNDKLFGEGGNDAIRGKDGNDTLVGGVGDDNLFGDGRNIAVNAMDNDILYGGLGKDTLTGGSGSDIFVFAAGDGGADLNNADTITDFEVGTDRIGLISLTFEQLTVQDVSGENAATLSFGGEVLAKLQGVSAAQLRNPAVLNGGAVNRNVNTSTFSFSATPPLSITNECPQPPNPDLFTPIDLNIFQVG